jgi:hypothetical protein
MEANSGQPRERYIYFIARVKRQRSTSDNAVSQELALASHCLFNLAKLTPKEGTMNEEHGVVS